MKLPGLNLAQLRSLLIAILAVMMASACGKSQAPGNNTDHSNANLESEEGTNVTRSFLLFHTGTFSDKESGESIQLFADGTYIRTFVRQVGADETPEVPYPTICSYKINGKVAAVIERNEAELNRYLCYASHLFKMTVEGMELSEELYAGTAANIHCQNFKKNFRSNRLRAGTETEYTEVLSGESFRFHTSGGGDYENCKLPRTASTLDEVFERVK